MEHFCAWCRTPLSGEVEAGAATPAPHLICPVCQHHMEHEANRSLRHYLDDLPAPVLLVDADNVTLMVNTQAQKSLGKDATEVEGNRYGFVIDCTSAFATGSCGTAPECAACLLNEAVRACLRSGQQFEGLKVALTLGSTAASAQKTMLTVSVRKVPRLEMVMLRIDSMEPMADPTSPSPPAAAGLK